MFRKTKRKIVAAIMASLVVFLISTLLVVYLSSYYGIKRENTDMLRDHLELLLRGERAYGAPPDKPDGAPDKGMGGRPEEDRLRDRPEYKLSTFYTVTVDENGTYTVDAGEDGVVGEDELKALAEKILDSGKTSGKSKGLLYMVGERDGECVIAFMDSTVSDNSMNELLKNILIFGGAAIVVIFFVSLFIASRIVKPLEENDRRQRQFVSDAGHELKTPVAVISANTELLSRQIGDNEWLSNIDYENARMGTLVTELLELSRTESAKLPKEEVDLSCTVVGEALPFESMAYERGFELVTDIEENIVVEGNTGKLTQLTSILLDNAFRHGKEGKVALSLKKDHKWAVLTVSNNADEIPPEKLSRLFERFYRVDEARVTEGDHYGLGLSIAKAIVDAHRGEISVSWQDGTITFTVKIPLK